MSTTYFLKICLLLLVYTTTTTAGGSIHIHGYNMVTTMSEDVKCIEKERQALLNFKQSLIGYSGMLSTWRDDDNSRDCCKWRGVVCSNETGHVLQLGLRGSFDPFSFTSTQYLSGEINITSLLELQNIEFLDLSSNNFYGSEIPKHMGSFNNLRSLNLSHSHFGGMIPSQLGKLTQLRYLDLSHNSIDGEIPHQLGNLSQLQYLDLTETYLSGAIPFHVGKLPMLQTLRLSGNSGLKINDGEWLSTLPSLTNLYLTSFPYFTHHLLPIINKLLPNLTELGLSDCQLYDNDIRSLFDSHSNFSTSLLSLDLSFNNIIMPFPPYLNFPSLVSLDLSYNNIIMPFPPYLNFLSLVVLDLSGNNLSASTILQVISNFNSKLEEIHLSDCHLSDSNFRSPSPSIMNFSSSLVSLDLSSNMLTSSMFQLLSNFSYFNNLQELHLVLNEFTSFPHYLSFPSLVILDLSYNNLSSSGVFPSNPNFAPKLEELHLRHCNLLDKSFPFFTNSSSSSLGYVDLSDNQLTSSAIFHWLFNFTNLHYLDLSLNLLECPIPDGFGEKMNNLQTLLMRSNKLKGEIPASLGNICTLQFLDLSSNNLSGEMSSFNQNSSRCTRHMLQIMDLSFNRITGLVPDFSIFPSLNYLDLSNNQLTGEIPKSIGLLSELRELSLNRNSLKGDITEPHFSNLSNLKELDFSDNSLSLKFDTKWDPPFQLFNLGLASCKLGPSIPSWLQTQRHLEFLDISNAGINDSVPVWLWNKLESIRRMNMSCNNLIGTIPNLPLKFRDDDDDETIYILNTNQFQGKVPSFLLQASILDLSKNKFSNLNGALCDNNKITKIKTLDLSNNQIKGQLSDCWGHLNSLEFVDLRNNKLSGTIPSSLTTLVNLEALVLRNNSFFGEFPSTLQNCTKLVILDVGENLLSGSIPSWIGENLQLLEILSLRKNLFFGTLSSHLCYLNHVHVLDLSRNSLSGRIPTCLKNFTAMVNKNMDQGGIVKGRLLSSRQWQTNIYVSNLILSWKGQEYVFQNPESRLNSIDLSSNHLSGEMPFEFGMLLGLVSLNLSRNNLSGEIPTNIGNLNSLEFLDLSRNRFSGRIPETLTRIDRLTMLDLSHNSLSGKIPLGTQLQSFNPSSFEGNLNLCGKPLEKICSEDETPINPQRSATGDKDDNSVFYEALYMSMGVGFFTGFWCLIGPLLIWQSWRNAYLRFLNKLTDYAYVTLVVNVPRCRKWLNA